MPKITTDQLQTYFASNGSLYPLYTDSVKLYEGLSVHSNGDYPKKMIEDRRPSEPDEILEYRKNTYKPITKLPISKVISSFGKIRRSPDWSINFPKDIPAGIVKEESLQEYCTNKLHGYGSITDWLFCILLRQNLIDPNALVAVIPLKSVVKDKYAEPVPILFNSNQVVAYDEERQFCILRARRQVQWTDNRNQVVTGRIYYYIDEVEIIIYEEGPGGFVEKFNQPNYIGQFPVFKVKAEAFKMYENMVLNRSRIDAMIPFLDEAACEYSDLKGSKIRNLYPLFWYFQNRDCKTCNGAKKIPNPTAGGQPITCSTCAGEGKVPFSPFVHMQVDPADLGKQAHPIPPAGFVARDVAILTLQEESVAKNIFKALSAVNMQFLDQTPLAISGDAKNVDREELNNTVYTVAEDLIYTGSRTIYFINEWRYFTKVPDPVKRAAMLPDIPVPENFDLLPEGYLTKEVSDARTGNINPLIIAVLEQQLAEKKFYNKPELSAEISLFYSLDPLPGYNVDQKMAMLSNNGITEIDYVVSNYMSSFIRRALKDDKNFASLDPDKQRAKLEEYAQEKIDANSQAKQLMNQLAPQFGPDGLPIKKNPDGSPIVVPPAAKQKAPAAPVA